MAERGATFPNKDIGKRVDNGIFALEWHSIEFLKHSFPPGHTFWFKRCEAQIGFTSDSSLPPWTKILRPTSKSGSRSCAQSFIVDAPTMRESGPLRFSSSICRWRSRSSRGSSLEAHSDTELKNRACQQESSDNVDVYGAGPCLAQSQADELINPVLANLHISSQFSCIQLMSWRSLEDSLLIANHSYSKCTLTISFVAWSGI